MSEISIASEPAYERCKSNLGQLADWYDAQERNRNEATTRHHLIDVLIHDCLAWDRWDVKLEESYDGKYTDYSFVMPRRIMIWEAKREGKYFEIPAGHKLEQRIATLLSIGKDISDAVEQVISYCQDRGVPLACVCNGHQLICFMASREDGKAPKEGKAIVFVSLREMAENFLELWQLLSKPAIIEGLYRLRLLGEMYVDLPPKLSTQIDGYPGYKARTDFQSELNILSDIVIEDITRHRDLERTFLKECYCESGALSQYSLMSKDVLEARYAALARSPDLAVDAIPMAKGGLSGDIVAESISGRPIILIGDRGVGKSMFLRYFINISAAELVENAISFYLDLGSTASLTLDLRAFVVDEIIRQLLTRYEIDICERNFVRSVYHGPLERFKRSIFADLLNFDPDGFRRKEMEFLEERLSDKSQFLKDALVELSRNRGKQVIVFLDNADQRDPAIQQAAFLIAQELASNQIAATFVALRPETFYESVRDGTLSGYNPRAFTISPPRIDKVIAKRLEFALKIVQGEVVTPVVLGGLRFTSERLQAIIKVFMESMLANNRLVECIDDLASGDVRLALSFIQRFLGSAHVKSDKIIDLFEKTGAYTIGVAEFLRGIIYGESEFYDPERSPVANLFDISRRDRREHFILPLLLGFLGNFKGNGHVEGFVRSNSAYEVLQGLGFLPVQIDRAVDRGIRHGLIEAGSRFVSESASLTPHVIRITQDGIYHFHKLAAEFEYIDAVVVDVPILDADVSASLALVYRFNERIDRAAIFCKYLDSCWALIGQSASLFDWANVSYRLRRQLGRLAGKGHGR